MGIKHDAAKDLEDALSALVVAAKAYVDAVKADADREANSIRRTAVWDAKEITDAARKSVT